MTQPDACIVRITNAQGATQGTGFLVSTDGLIATCAHVVEGMEPSVAFPGGEPCPVHVVAADEAHDVAILQLQGELPDRAEPARLGRSIGAYHRDFWSRGYRPLGEMEGIPAEGRVLHAVSECPAVDYMPLILKSQDIRKGMSGAPVYIPDWDLVVGMITDYWDSLAYWERLKDRSETGTPFADRDTALATPAEAITALYPDIRLWEPPPELSRPPLGIPFQAPAVPRYFVARPEVSNELKAHLLAEEATAPGTLVVSAVHGLGGIGKTTLVAALTHDPDLHARFPDGILWATLGQQADVLSLLVGWIQALRDYDFRPTVAESASNHLRTLLHDKACLLVVDDAWQAAHVRSFLVGGDRCRVLVTTRDTTLARKVGARLYDLDVMTEAQALALFEARLGPLDGHRDHAATLSRELGYLPLALELAAAQVEAGYSWDELLDVFRRELADLAALDLDEATYRNESLRLSFRLSLERLSPEDQDAFAWLGVLPEDALLNPVMAAILWDQPEADARRRLHRLRDKALLKMVGDNRYTLHDLLHDEAKLWLVERMPLPEAHGALLECYRAQTQDGLWHTLPGDGYIHEHLIWHMEQAGWHEEIHTLLREETPQGYNGWFEIRERLGQTAGYLKDVTRALACAERQYGSSAQQFAVGLQCRYALVLASIRSLARNVPPALLAALLEKSVWTVSQGVVYAIQVPDPKQQAEALEILIDQMEKRGYPNEILAIARQLENAESKAQLVWLLVSDSWGYMSRQDSDRALRAIMAIRSVRKGDNQGLRSRFRETHSESEWREEWVSEEWVSEERYSEEWVSEERYSEEWVSEEVDSFILEEAFYSALETGNDERVSAIVCRLTELGHFEEAIAALEAITDSFLQLEVLLSIIPNSREEMLEEAWFRLWDAGDISEQVALASATAKHLSPGLLRKVARRVCQIEDARVMEATLSVLTRVLSERLMREVVTLIFKGGTTGERVDIVSSTLIPHMSGDLKKWALKEALTAVREITDAKERAHSLIEIVPHLPELEKAEILEETLTAIQDIAYYDIRAYELSRVAPYLSARLVPLALQVARHIGDALQGLKAFLALIPYLPRESVGSALSLTLALALRLEIIEQSDAGLSNLITCLNAADGLDAIKSLTQGIEYVMGIAESLLDLAPQIGELKPERILIQALSSRDIEWIDGKVGMLFGLVLSLVEVGYNSTALAVARKVDMEVDRAMVLSELASHLPGEWQEQALFEVQEIEKRTRARRSREEAPTSRTELEVAIEECADMLLDIAHDLKTVSDRGEDEGERATELSTLATKLAETHDFTEALAIVTEIKSFIDDEWFTWYGDPSFGDRIDAIVEIKFLVARLAPQVAELGFPKEALEAVSAIEEPELVDATLSDIALRLGKLGYPAEALEVVWMIADLTTQVRVVSLLAPHLPEALLRHVLAMAHGILGEEERAEVLAELSPQLLKLGNPEDALGTVREIRYTDKRAKAFAEMAPYLVQWPIGKLFLMWRETLHFLVTRTRGDLLSDLSTLSPLIAALGGPEAIAETFRAIQDVGRWWP